MRNQKASTLQLVRDVKLRLLVTLALTLALTTPSAASLLSWGRPKAAASTVTEATAGHQLTYAEFKALALELAPKVDLFRDTWAFAPQAEFFGGTSRDYLYWLKGRLAKARTGAELSQIVAELRARSEIKLREFVQPNSDVDIVAKRDSFVLDPARYGVKKIDFVNIARFNVAHPVGETEVKQGFIPIEKIRLSQASVFTDVQFGDGVKELFLSRPTVRFASDREFAESYYAKLGINHPILLALRYIRIVAMDHRERHGNEKPALEHVLNEMDRASHDAVMKVITKAANGRELLPYIENPKFLEWFEAAAKKTAAANTNAAVSELLMDHFGANEISARHPSLRPLMPARASARNCPQLFL